MKNNKVLFLIVLLLGAVTAWFYFNNRNSTLGEELRDFAVNDTAAVVKIFLADKSGKKVLLERKSADEWVVDGSQWARPDAVNMLLRTLHDVEVRSPVGKKATNNTLKSLASKGIKVEIYNSQGLFKTMYVGGPTMDQLGTFMYIENSSAPFITHIPGFNGYLTPRFIVDRTEWVVKNVFRLSDGELKSLMVADRERPGYAFHIEKSSSSSDYVLYDGFDKKVESVSQDKLISYLQFYRVLNFEALEKSLVPDQRDSLRSTVPFRTIILVKQNGDSSRVDLWRRPVTTQTTNKTMADGKPFPYDVDRMTATLNRDTSLVIVQYFSFEKLFRKPSDFQNVSSVSKRN